MSNDNLRFKAHAAYINAAGAAPMHAERFDRDHEPIGPDLRSDLYHAGVIEYAETDGPVGEWVALTSAGMALLD